MVKIWINSEKHENLTVGSDRDWDIGWEACGASSRLVRWRSLMWRARGSRAARERAFESDSESRTRRNPPPDSPTRDSGALSIWSRQRQRGESGFLNACHTHIESGGRCTESPSCNCPPRALWAFWLLNEHSTNTAQNTVKLTLYLYCLLELSVTLTRRMFSMRRRGEWGWVEYSGPVVD